MSREREQGISQLGAQVLQRLWGGVCAVEEVKVLWRVKRWSRDRTVQKGRPLVVMMRVLY